MSLDAFPLETLAARVGTPFYLYDGQELRAALGRLRALAAADPTPDDPLRDEGELGAQGARAGARGGDVDRRGQRQRGAAGRPRRLPLGAEPPVIMLTADVYRDNALEVILRHGVLPNVGSPGQIRQLADAGYRGPIVVRVNPGFGHGHVQSCDTGGPSSKHGIWYEDPILSDAARARRHAPAAHRRPTRAHRHRGRSAGLRPQRAQAGRLLRRPLARLPRRHDGQFRRRHSASLSPRAAGL